MLTLAQTSPRAISALEFETRLLRFINKELPQLDRQDRAWPPVSTTTPLFATGLVDSLSILHLIAAVESLTGCAVPDQLVVMKHFQNVEAMSAAFFQPTITEPS